MAGSMFGQVSGNINYETTVRYADSNIDLSFPANADLLVSVKGLANAKADAYVAIFSVAQSGKTTEEVNKLIDERIGQALGSIKAKEGVETYVDMISFVPVYEYQSEKKMFSKRTYNEMPKGFEIKKNIHVKYTNPVILDEIISTFSNVEIYDLVRVDYFSTKLEATKKDLREKAKAILEEKLKNYQAILSVKLDSVGKQVVDGYKVVLPVEMYNDYQAYSSSSLNLKKNPDINQVDKSTTLYYQPIMDKEFDFVLNPTILEPVIQVMYEIKLKLNNEKVNDPKTSKEYLLISPSGDLKSLNIK